MEVVTPLGDDLLFHRLHAREEVSRLSEFELDLLSPKRDINLDDVLGKSFTVKLELARRQDSLLQRLRHALRADRHARALPRLSRHAAALALVPHPHFGLPHLSGEDRP